MPVATYGGLALFGRSASVRPARADRDRQVNTYPGVDGVESIDLGGRGGTTAVEGTWFCESEAELAAILATWEAAMDGTGRFLIDTLGRAWPDVILGPYRLDGARRMNAMTGSVMQKFVATLIHLT